MSATYEKPGYIPSNYNAFMLIKFFYKESYMDDFINGKLYMNCLSRFWPIVEKNDGRNDNYEGTEELLRNVNGVNHALLINQSGDPLIISVKGDLPEKSIPVIEAVLGKGKNAEKKILSLYSLWLDYNKNTLLRISPELRRLGKYAFLS